MSVNMAILGEKIRLYFTVANLYHTLRLLYSNLGSLTDHHAQRTAKMGTHRGRCVRSPGKQVVTQMCTQNRCPGSGVFLWMPSWAVCTGPL